MNSAWIVLGSVVAIFVVLMAPIWVALWFGEVKSVEREKPVIPAEW